jgi:serine/threonine-protein kinase
MTSGDGNTSDQHKREAVRIMETLDEVLGEKYIFHRVIGCGGIGYILLAEHRLLHSLVAFKVLQEAFNQDAIMVTRFQQEAKAAALLAHPHIIPIYDIGQAGSHNYFIMRYIEGEDLSALLLRQGRLPVERAVPIGAQVAEALQYAHSKGVIHRDIKPANILLDVHGNAVVTDFGIARSAAAAPLTTQGAILGTPHYMSPEQVRGESLDARCDPGSGAGGGVCLRRQRSGFCLAGKKPGRRPAERGVRSEEPPRIKAGGDGKIYCNRV